MTEVARRCAVENLNSIITLIDEAAEAAEDRSVSTSRFALAKSGFQTAANTNGELRDMVLEDSVVHLRAAIEIAQTNEVLVPARNALQLCSNGQRGETDV